MTKTAMITGGQQGIGLGIAQALSDAGWQIILVSERSPEAEAVQAARATLPSARYLQHDLRSLEGIEGLLDAVGPIDCLVSNAGVPAMARGDLLEMSPESFDRCMEVNLRGTFFLAQAVARRMLQNATNEYRSLLFVTSVSAEIVSADRAEYCISKAGASMMVKAFAARLAQDNIGVFELRPGIIDTPMTAPVADRYEDRIAGGLVPAGRWGKPQDIGAVALPLAEGRFRFATGAAIPVDGGLSIQRL